MTEMCWRNYSYARWRDCSLDALLEWPAHRSIGSAKGGGRPRTRVSWQLSESEASTKGCQQESGQLWQQGGAPAQRCKVALPAVDM